MTIKWTKFAEQLGDRVRKHVSQKESNLERARIEVEIESDTDTDESSSGMGTSSSPVGLMGKEQNGISSYVDQTPFGSPYGGFNDPTSAAQFAESNVYSQSPFSMTNQSPDQHEFDMMTGAPIPLGQPQDPFLDGNKKSAEAKSLSHEEKLKRVIEKINPEDISKLF